MTIFSVGMTAILALIHSTIDNSIWSRHEIVASNLLREEIELMKNIRNSNVRSFVPWDTVFTGWSQPWRLSAWIYTLENDYTATWVIYTPWTSDIEHSHIYMENITAGILGAPDIDTKFKLGQLYLDNKWRFTHTITGSGTNFASYVIISPLIVNTLSWPIEPKDVPIVWRNQWYILDARVITKWRGWYREYDLKTVITDWKK
jgi:hypothetical protein